MGFGLLSGDYSTAMRGALAGMEQDEALRQRKLKEAEAERRRIELKQAVEREGFDPAVASDPDLFRSMYLDKHKRREPTEWDRLTQGLSPDEVNKARRVKLGLEAKPGDSEYGTTPIWGTDAEGNTTVLQLGRNGTVAQPKLPEGVKLSSGVDKVDLGTRWGLLDKRTGQIVGYEPKDNAGAARDTEIGKAEGQAVAGAGNQLAAADTALDVIQQIKEHPNRTSATGWQSNFPTFKGGKTADFENLVEQSKNGAFLTAIQQMRGLGALSEQEGKAATAAINRMNVATSDEGFMKAVSDYEAIVRRGRDRAQMLLSRRPGSSGAGAPSGGGRIRFDAQGNPM
ncbi:hypothetical protein KBI52_10995 [Microvirga sp. HBU67558]|uniref:hypothetical protein n=1 Tax=Microvirga sp. HBU67558 TaxID=2824562 RepID=UPI001B38BFF7|nr:hypothetical protein [Microvirga sp. HBU67558]MBQ0820732.1 hypothetical protein [Microvirga sp. HBU67558]